MTISRCEAAILQGVLLAALFGCGQADVRAAEKELQGFMMYDSVEQRDQEFQKFLDRRTEDRSRLDAELRSLGFRDAKPERGCEVLEREDRDATPTVLLCPDAVAGFVGPGKVSE